MSSCQKHVSQNCHGMQLQKKEINYSRMSSTRLRCLLRVFCQDFVCSQERLHVPASASSICGLHATVRYDRTQPGTNNLSSQHVDLALRVQWPQAMHLQLWELCSCKTLISADPLCLHLSSLNQAARSSKNPKQYLAPKLAGQAGPAGTGCSPSFTVTRFDLSAGSWTANALPQSYGHASKAKSYPR